MYENFLWKLLSFHTKMILAWFLWGSVFLRGELRKYAKKSSFENFDSALYSTSVSMPLRLYMAGTFFQLSLKKKRKKKKKKKKWNFHFHIWIHQEEHIHMSANKPVSIGLMALEASWGQVSRKLRRFWESIGLRSNICQH